MSGIGTATAERGLLLRKHRGDLPLRRAVDARNVVVTNGRFSITAYLEASRRGQDANGRQYVLTVTATGLGGNYASATAGVVVAHDRHCVRVPAKEVLESEL
jgi:hypothetical protein